MPNKLEQDRDFIDWLKKNGCSDGIIDGISKFGDTDLSTFKKRVKKQPDLLTALVENGYNSKAINLTFLHSDDQMYKGFLKYKSFVIKSLQNQCPDDFLTYLYCISRFYNKRILQHQEVYMTFFKYFPRLTNNISSINTIMCLFQDDKRNLKKLENNFQLYRLLMINGISYTILDQLVDRKDFKNLKINDNQELLNFLLNNQLITFDEDKLNFIRGHPLITSLLKTGDLTIADLYERIEEIQRKIDKLSRSKINEKHKQLKLPSNISQNIELTCDNGVWSLQALATVAIVKNIQKDRLPNSSLEEVETACAETRASRCIL